MNNLNKSDGKILNTSKNISKRSIIIDENNVNTEVIQLLHPSWRMVPHLNLFGWTKEHEDLEQYLRKKMKNRLSEPSEVRDLFYTSENEYHKAESQFESVNKTKFLSAPIVTTAEGIWKILEKNEAKILSKNVDFEEQIVEWHSNIINQ